MKSSTSANLQNHNQRTMNTMFPLQIKKIKSPKTTVVAGWTNFPPSRPATQIYCESSKSNRDARRFDEVENACLLLDDLSEPLFIVYYARIQLIVCSLDCPSFLEACSRKEARK